MGEAALKDSTLCDGAQRQIWSGWIRHYMKHIVLCYVVELGMASDTSGNSQISSTRMILASNLGTTRPTIRAILPTDTAGLGGGGGSALIDLTLVVADRGGTLREDGK